MINVICIGGLPGSGKTTHAKELAKKTNGVLIDDFSMDHGNFDRLSAVDNGTVIIVDNFVGTDATKVKLMLEKHIKHKFGLKFIMFRNNPSRCWYNIVTRNDGRVISRHYVYALSERYRPQDFDCDLMHVFYDIRIDEL